MRVAGVPAFGCVFSGRLGPHAPAFPTSPAFNDLSVQPAQGLQRAPLPPDPLDLQTREDPTDAPRAGTAQPSLAGAQPTGGRGGGNGSRGRGQSWGARGTSKFLSAKPNAGPREEACVLRGSPAIGCSLGRQESEQIFP